MRINCAITGAVRSPFFVTIDTSTTVEMLKGAIKTQNRDITCLGQDIELFLARKDGTAWLKVNDLYSRESTTDESTYMVEKLEDADDKIYNKLPSPISDDDIHVLVKASTKARGLHAIRRIAQKVASEACKPSKLPKRTPKMKKGLVEVYQRSCEQISGNGEPMLLCMVMDIALPSCVVIASHIFQRHSHHGVAIVGLNDIDDVRNGLLLFKPIEGAMDDLDIAFVRSEDKQLTLKIINETMWRDLLVDRMTDEQWEALGLDSLPTGWKYSERPLSAPNAPSFDVLTTFDELDGKLLHFPSDPPPGLLDGVVAVCTPKRIWRDRRQLKMDCSRKTTLSLT
ncbi:hypothetical protein P3T76_003849 [Phytophthora citrophthora]|uniref:HNH nuclease domain-containing protein n=1 Tax=Phytophthora citrophthora TaxID=4793 RepID=A0AAD9GWE5_9STRA|nr:hypothetical protein P3T76_003849 [Phytophthora citrophthora]